MAKQYVDQEYLARVGKRLFEIREDRKITQEALAELADIDPRQIGRIERAENNSSISLIKKIADVLNIRVGEILDI